MLQCPNCNGNKVITEYVEYYGEDQEMECAYCDGTGIVSEEDASRW